MYVCIKSYYEMYYPPTQVGIYTLIIKLDRNNKLLQIIKIYF